MLQEIPMLDRFAAARGRGFGAVECQLPYDHPAEGLARTCGDEKLQFVMFNPPPGDIEAGEYGISDLSGREAEFRDSIGQALEYAKTLESRFIHVLASIVPDSESRERCLECMSKI
jgi:hydroxypyruvate isomerase